MRLTSSLLLSRAPPREVRGSGRLQCRVAVDIVAFDHGVSAEAILSPRRAEAHVAFARHVAMYLANVIFQLPLAVVADGFGRDRSSVAYALARVEDARDDRDFDRRLAMMEELAASCRRLAQPGALHDEREGGR